MMYHNELELIFHKLDGLAFQDFFNELMTKAEPGFHPVRQRIDGGNDGFIKDKGIYFQVFAPESITKKTIDTGSSKLVNDFDKLLRNWHYTTPIEKYIFVFNDKLKGLDSDLIKRISDLEKERNITTKLYTSLNLIEIFNENLTNNQKEYIISKYTFGPSNKTAVYIAAKLVSENLSIEKWRNIDEYLSFNSIYKVDIDVLRDIMLKLFSIEFKHNDKIIINDLINKINDIIKIFHTPLTREWNNERQWDNSWKQIDPNPKARYYDEEFVKWDKEVDLCTLNLCRSLNKFAVYIRENYIADYLDYKSYTICRRKNEGLNEYMQIKP